MEDEKVFYDTGDTKVTASRIIIANKTYQLSNISSCEIAKSEIDIPDLKKIDKVTYILTALLAVIGLILGGYIGLIDFSDFRSFSTFSAVMIGIIGVGAYFAAKKIWLLRAPRGSYGANSQSYLTSSRKNSVVCMALASIPSVIWQIYFPCLARQSIEPSIGTRIGFRCNISKQQSAHLSYKPSLE